MTADRRSAIPSVPGVSWYWVIAIAAVPTAIGAAVDLLTSGELGTTYNVLFILGCVAAALWARPKALFTAAFQPPLVAAVVGLLALFFDSLSQNSKQGLKTAVLNMALPFANTFPWILTGFLLAVSIVVVRALIIRSTTVKTGTKPERKPAPQPKQAKPAKANKPKSAPAAKRQSKPAKPSAGPAARKQTAVAAAEPAPRPVRRAQPQTIPPRPQPARRGRRTAGQQLRDQAHIEDLTAGLDD